MRRDAAASPASTSPRCISAGIADADRGRNEALAGVEADPGRLGLVARRQQRGAFGRGLQRLGDHHRDRLVGVAHPIVLQQVEPEHERVAVFASGSCASGGLFAGVMTSTTPGCAFAAATSRNVDAAARDAADRQHGVEHAGRVVVGGVAGARR